MTYRVQRQDGKVLHPDKWQNVEASSLSGAVEVWLGLPSTGLTRDQLPMMIHVAPDNGRNRHPNGAPLWCQSFRVTAGGVE